MADLRCIAVRVLQIQDISKNESNSQPHTLESKVETGATNIGYIKERKQFTTDPRKSVLVIMVLQIQDISKNESNSQRLNDRFVLSERCYKYRIYQRTKAIHNILNTPNCRFSGATNIGYIKERKQFTTLKVRIR